MSSFLRTLFSCTRDSIVYGCPVSKTTPSRSSFSACAKVAPSAGPRLVFLRCCCSGGVGPTSVLRLVQLQPSKRGPCQSQMPSPKESSEAPPRPLTPSDWQSRCRTHLLQRRKTDRRPSCRQLPTCQRVSLLAICLVWSLVLLF